jgi:hypothetical protein
MDFSKLDFGASSVCVPGEWKLDSSYKVAQDDTEGITTMAELLESTVPKQGIRFDPAARFAIPEVKQITPDMKMELAAIKLKRYAYKDKFMKNADSNKMPTRFHIGTVIGGGLMAVGGGKESQAAGVSNKKKKSGKSHLQGLLRDENVRSWLKKNITKKTTLPARPKSKHKPIKPRH